MNTPRRPEGAAGGSGRPPLNREMIVEAAIAQVDAHGLQSLTMRSLGTRLGVEAMSLYYYINGREDLLERMVDHLVRGIRVPPESALGPSDGWQGYIQQVAHAVRELALQHPTVFPLVATRPPAAPWLRPPLRSLGMVEDFLAALTRRGLSDAHAVEAYKVFTSFLLGHLLLEVSIQGAPTGPIEEPLNEGDADHPTPDAQASLDDFPTVARLRDALTHHDPDAEFAKGLENLLDQLDLLVSQ